MKALKMGNIGKISLHGGRLRGKGSLNGEGVSLNEGKMYAKKSEKCRIYAKKVLEKEIRCKKSHNKGIIEASCHNEEETICKKQA